jgi:Argonaute siRNA chaperone (ARC) complex subunit Arb1
LLSSYHPVDTFLQLKPTGFEEDHCDPPITPEEAKDEEQMYAPSNPFSERIEIAIQRYSAKRTFHQDYMNAFNSFMKFGGIDTGPRQFTGRFKKEDLEKMDAAQIALAKATHFAGEDKDDPQKWAVDFQGIAKAYLSSKLENTDDDTVELNTRVMTNFYNYIMMHEVCPEYTDDILAARAICAQAKKELNIIRVLDTLLPGRFNTAISALFGGYYSTIFGDNSWDPNFDENESYFFGQRQEEARITLLTALTSLGSDALYDAVAPPQNIAQHPAATIALENSWTSNLHISQTIENIGLVVIDIQLASEKVKGEYVDHKKMLRKKIKKLQPLGKLLCKRWSDVDDYHDYDLPSRTSRRPVDLDQTFDIWVEHNTLKLCFVGLLLLVNLSRLEAKSPADSAEKRAGPTAEGIWYFDQVNRIYPSFYTCVLNELTPTKVRVVKYLEATEGKGTENRGE